MAQEFPPRNTRFEADHKGNYLLHAEVQRNWKLSDGVTYQWYLLKYIGVLISNDDKPMIDLGNKTANRACVFEIVSGEFDGVRVLIETEVAFRGNLRYFEDWPKIPEYDSSFSKDSIGRRIRGAIGREKNRCSWT